MQLQNPSKLLNCSSVTHENEITKMRCTRLNLQDTYIHLLDSTCKGLVMQLHCETHTHTHTHTHTSCPGLCRWLPSAQSIHRGQERVEIQII